TSTEQDDFELALALSLHEDVKEDNQIQTSEETSRRTKRSDIHVRDFFFRERVSMPSLPYWCDCGRLNSRKKVASLSGWHVCRVWCVCGKERPGWWTCLRCTFENKLQSYDVKWNLCNDPPPPPHQCEMCFTKTREVT